MRLCCIPYGPGPPCFSTNVGPYEAPGHGFVGRLSHNMQFVACFAREIAASGACRLAVVDRVRRSGWFRGLHWGVVCLPLRVWPWPRFSGWGFPAAGSVLPLRGWAMGRLSRSCVPSVVCFICKSLNHRRTRHGASQGGIVVAPTELAESFEAKFLTPSPKDPRKKMPFFGSLGLGVNGLLFCAESCPRRAAEPQRGKRNPARREILGWCALGKISHALAKPHLRLFGCGPAALGQPRTNFTPARTSALSSPPGTARVGRNQNGLPGVQRPGPVSRSVPRD
jgi:hypothetical protein